MEWRLVPIADFAEPVTRPERIAPERSYTLLGMRSQIGGPFARETKVGAEISAKMLNRVKSGDFIYSRLFAWQGSFGIVPDSLDNCHVSNEFPIFRLDRESVEPKYLVYWFGLPETQRAVEADCFGSTPGTRNRYKEDYFLRLRTPLPPLEEQRRIVARLDRVAAMVETRRREVAAADAEMQALLSKAFARAIDGAPRRPMAEVAPLVRRPVEIDPTTSYPELGVRSFGRGTFHKPDLPGMKVGTKRLFRIEQGDLLFNIVFAWEGAVAIAQAEDSGRVGSHRFLTCVPDPEIATAEFLLFYFLSRDGLERLGEASPGGAGRNRTLGLKKLEAIQVPVPPLETQRWFDRLQAKARQIRTIRAGTAQDIDALIPAMLHEVFNGKAQAA